MSYSYASLDGIPLNGLRFFTVYGPWGRPDMSPWLFTDRILSGRPVEVFNHGQMRRDFTYVDDIAAGVLAALDRPPAFAAGQPPVEEIGRASCRESVCQYVLISVVAASLKKKTNNTTEKENN